MRQSDAELWATKEPPAYEQYLVDTRSGTKLSFSDVGFGIAQVLPVLMALHTFSDTVHIEQPEAQHQPALQAELADELIVSVKQVVHNRLIVETHSEHVVLRLLRRIRETAHGSAPCGLRIDAKDVSLIFVERIDSKSRVRHVRLAEDGSFLDPWPYGFFPERLPELQ